MKITFIRPNTGDHRSKDAMKPLTFAILASLTPAGVDLELYDERVEDVPMDLQTDMVAMTIETYTAKRAYTIARWYRNRGIPVVAGGFHASLATEEVAGHVDAVVKGDAEGVWAELVSDWLRGGMKSVYQADPACTMENVRYDRTIFRGKKYALLEPVQFGRGCSHSCEFCSIKSFYGNALKRRKVEETIGDIRASGSKWFFFVDDNILADPDGLTELVRALIPLKVKWVCQIDMQIIRNTELLRLMARSARIITGFPVVSLMIRVSRYQESMPWAVSF